MALQSNPKPIHGSMETQDSGSKKINTLASSPNTPFSTNPKKTPSAPSPSLDNQPLTPQQKNAEKSITISDEMAKFIDTLINERWIFKNANLYHWKKVLEVNPQFNNSELWKQIFEDIFPRIIEIHFKATEIQFLQELLFLDKDDLVKGLAIIERLKNNESITDLGNKLDPKVLDSIVNVLIDVELEKIVNKISNQHLLDVDNKLKQLYVKVPNLLKECLNFGFSYREYRPKLGFFKYNGEIKLDNGKDYLEIILDDRKYNLEIILDVIKCYQKLRQNDAKKFTYMGTFDIIHTIQTSPWAQEICENEPSLLEKLYEEAELEIDNIVDELTLVFSKLYQPLTLEEILKNRAGRSDYEQSCPNLKRISDMHTNLMRKVLTDILTTPPKSRVKMVEFYISVAKKCSDKKIFIGSSAIVGALCSSSISRLNVTMDDLPLKSRQTLKELDVEMHANTSTKEDALRLMEEQKGSLPLLAPFLTMFSMQSDQLQKCEDFKDTVSRKLDLFLCIQRGTVIEDYIKKLETMIEEKLDTKSKDLNEEINVLKNDRTIAIEVQRELCSQNSSSCIEKYNAELKRADDQIASMIKVKNENILKFKLFIEDVKSGINQTIPEINKLNFLSLINNFETSPQNEKWFEGQKNKKTDSRFDTNTYNKSLEIEPRQGSVTNKKNMRSPDRFRRVIGEAKIEQRKQNNPPSHNYSLPNRKFPEGHLPSATSDTFSDSDITEISTNNGLSHSESFWRWRLDWKDLKETTVEASSSPPNINETIEFFDLFFQGKVKDPALGFPYKWNRALKVILQILENYSLYTVKEQKELQRDAIQKLKNQCESALKTVQCKDSYDKDSIKENDLNTQLTKHSISIAKLDLEIVDLIQKIENLGLPDVKVSAPLLLDFIEDYQNRRLKDRMHYDTDENTVLDIIKAIQSYSWTRKICEEDKTLQDRLVKAERVEIANIVDELHGGFAMQFHGLTRDQILKCPIFERKKEFFLQCPELSLFAAACNQLNDKIAIDILSESNQDLRVKVIEFYINIASKSFEKKNLIVPSVILNVFALNSITRLQNTFDALSSEMKSVLQDLKSKVLYRHHDGITLESATVLMEQQKEYLPYLYLYISAFIDQKDYQSQVVYIKKLMTFIEEIKKKFPPMKHFAFFDRILKFDRFEKYRVWYQSENPKLPRSVAIENNTWNRSLQLEPKSRLENPEVVGIPNIVNALNAGFVHQFKLLAEDKNLTNPQFERKDLMNCTPLTHLTTAYHHLVKTVIVDILEAKNGANPTVRMIEFYIKIAKQSLDIENLIVPYAILAAFASKPIARLEKAFSQVSRKMTSVLESLKGTEKLKSVSTQLTLETAIDLMEQRKDLLGLSDLSKKIMEAKAKKATIELKIIALKKYIDRYNTFSEWFADITKKVEDPNMILQFNAARQVLDEIIANAKAEVEKNRNLDVKKQWEIRCKYAKKILESYEKDTQTCTGEIKTITENYITMLISSINEMKTNDDSTQPNRIFDEILNFNSDPQNQRWYDMSNLNPQSDPFEEITYKISLQVETIK